MPRKRSPRRPRRVGVRISVVAVVVIIAAASVADHLGLFGSTAGDYDRYHNASATVVRIVDGDTLHLDIRDGRHDTTAVRLWGIDTSEMNHGQDAPPEHFAREATQRAAELADGKQVRIELIRRGRQRDPYGRLLAYIYLPDGTMLNRRLIAEGFGYADTRFDHPRMADFRNAEKHAEKDKLGLWKDATPDDWPGWRRRYYHVEGASGS